MERSKRRGRGGQGSKGMGEMRRGWGKGGVDTRKETEWNEEGEEGLNDFLPRDHHCSQ